MVIAKLLGHDAVTCIAEQRIILQESRTDLLLADILLLSCCGLTVVSTNVYAEQCYKPQNAAALTSCRADPNDFGETVSTCSGASLALLFGYIYLTKNITRSRNLVCYVLLRLASFLPSILLACM